jgi:hypothetical protein
MWTVDQFEDYQFFLMGQDAGQLICCIDKKQLTAGPDQLQQLLEAKGILNRTMKQAFCALAHRYQVLLKCFDLAKAKVLSTDEKAAFESNQKPRGINQYTVTNQYLHMFRVVPFQDYQFFCLGQETGHLLSSINEKLVSALPHQQKKLLQAKSLIDRAMAQAFCASENRYQLLCRLFDKAQVIVLLADEKNISL